MAGKFTVAVLWVCECLMRTISFQSYQFKPLKFPETTQKIAHIFIFLYCILHTDIHILNCTSHTRPSIAIRFQSTHMYLQMSYFHLRHWKKDFECISLIVWLHDTSRMTEGWPYIRAADNSPSRYTVAVSVSLSLFLVPLAFSMIVTGNCVMNKYLRESMPQLCEHTHARARRTQQITTEKKSTKNWMRICDYLLIWMNRSQNENE